MSVAPVKSAVKRLGLYRHARWVRRHVFKRAELNDFRAEQRLYRDLVRPGDLCFDVGANFGWKTEVLMSLGARVISFEPQPDCAVELRDRIPGATVIRSAVGSAPGTITLHIDPHHTGSSVLPGWQDRGTDAIQVPVTTLDVAIQQFGVPAFCKIDVEGYELEVLKGLSTPIRSLSFEFTGHRLTDALACLDNLERFGPYEANVTPSDRPEFVSPHWLSPSDVRAFLVRELPRDPERFGWGDVFVCWTHP